MVFGVILPIVHVDIRETRDEKLELLLVEDGNELRWDNIMEPFGALVNQQK